ncbi:MAG: GEVED domain-containing protein [Limisphaera sp.]|nr:GEVED domain-containing protein [Limisphaera sp.]
MMRSIRIQWARAAPDLDGACAASEVRRMDARHRLQGQSPPRSSMWARLGVALWVLAQGFASAQPSQDFGDAPAPYPTKLVETGAWHPIGGPRFGSVVDGESDGQPTANATGDDVNPVGAADDEDGITFLTPLVPGQLAMVQIVISGTGFQVAYVSAWIDFGIDGRWTEPQDRILNAAPMGVGTHVREFVVPSTAKLGATFARFRVSTRAVEIPHDKATDGEVEDYQVVLASGTLDFGDAPGVYPTLLQADGARHTPNGPRLGQLVDTEQDGQPNIDATGDDKNPIDLNDEDGVTFLTALVPGLTAQVEVRVSGNVDVAYLDAWIDFSGNGTWSDTGEQIFRTQRVVRGTNVLSFPVPATAVTRDTYARFRISMQGGLGFAGAASDGEVEDYRITISPLQLDYGDAPGRYPTLLTQDGARHGLSSGFCLGTRVDLEPDGQPHPNALGDDLNPASGGDDEDGVIFLTPLIAGQSATIRVILTAPMSPTGGPGSGRLDAWIDYNGNESWADPGEQICTNRLITAGTNDLVIAVPAGVTPGTSFARFRLSRQGGLWVTGLAVDGEVEDHQVQLERRHDFGDAPRPYPTLLADNGARHLVSRDTYLGARADEESDGQPTPAADGDDLNPAGSPDDEDGVWITSPVVPGRSVTVQVTASRSGRLFAWMDFNRNGSWADPGEQIFAGTTLAAGVNNLSFVVPTNAALGTTFTRWRFTVQGSDLSFVGLAPDGEVEDHLVRILADRERCDLGCEGREFWLAFPGNYAPDPTNPPQPVLCIQGPAGAAGVVTIAALGYVTNFVIPGNLTAWIRLPALADLGSLSDVVLPGRGVWIRTTADVRVTAFHLVRHTSDSYQAFHASALGNQYVVMAWPNLHVGVPPMNASQFVVVGTESNTVVTIVPSATAQVRAPGVPYTVLLQPGDVYQLRDTNDAPADLTGTIIAADKPVAVFAGHGCAVVPTATQWYCDTIVEQLLPVNLWGQEFYVGPLAGRAGGSVIRVVAAYPGTAVSVNGSLMTTLMAGQVYQTLIPSRARLNTSRPALAALVATSSDYDGATNADPFMVLLPATRHFASGYRVVAPTNGFPTNFIQLAVPIAVTNSVQLDGTPVSPALFQAVPGSSYAVANVPVSPGLHLVSASEPFGILSYGWALYDSYGHAGCFYFGDVLPPTLTPPITHVVVDVTQNQQMPGFAVVPDLRELTQSKDNCTPQLGVPTQDPPPGTRLAPGRYVIRLTLTDSNGNPGQTNVQFTAVDPSPVTIRCPQDVVVSCNTNQGAVVAFSVQAFTRYETNVAVASVPPSGSVFPPGTTTVTNVATSLAGNTAMCTFKVTVVCERKLHVQRGPEGLTLSWAPGGVLEQASSLAGPWQTVAGASSPYTVRPTAQRLFFRVRY